MYSVGRNHTVACEEGTLLKSAILLKHFRATEINKLKQAQRQRETFIISHLSPKLYLPPHQKPKLGKQNFLKRLKNVLSKLQKR